ncbi:glycosyltransferase family 4 protein [Arthrobacter sp. MI7-26]|uniref:glycosyltransferase family 4 protein n=1 Tax=Arthrobacter sp. MI7-26 TaxID=2993653 RepID=UPI002249665D|nr:glycosyltransferase family 4 protein [Arthrobacter sp. MI7-26]MCX2750273.1 glycosyltransferase family 4 protein [Arthrobacter sp. MI7-26]
MPRILVQLNSLALGGTQINAVDLAAAVRDYGYESVLFGPTDTLPRGPSLFDVAAERGVELGEFERPTSTMGGARTMARLAKDHQADLIHVYGSWTSRPAWWGPCLLGRRPLVLTVYEMSVDPMTPRNTGLIVGTKYLEEDLATRPGGIELISPPVDVNRDDSRRVSARGFVERLGLHPENLRVVMVTRLDEEMKAMGIRCAIRAIGRIGSPTVDLVIVGTGDAREGLGQLAEQVNEEQGRRAIVLAGPMADPRAAYAAADVMIGMGGSAARSLSFGKPLVVAGESGWFKTFTPQSAKELFRNSFWSPESMRDPVEALVGSLKPLLESDARREELGSFGREFAELNFGLPAMAQRLAATYDKALRNYRLVRWCRDAPLELAHARRRFVERRENTP